MADTLTKTKTRTPKAKARSFSDLHANGERIVALNNGFGNWDSFLFGSFTELGTKCLEDAQHLSIHEALAQMGGDFTVGKYPLHADTPGGRKQVHGQWVTVREDTWQPLGVVGDGYTVVQPEVFEQVAMAVDVAAREQDDAPVGFIGGALLNGGARMALLYALAPLSIGKDEAVLPVLLIWTSHDGTKAIELTFVPIRLACFNGNMWHVEGTSSVFKVKHTVTAEARLNVAAEGLAVGNQFFQDWFTEAKTLVRQRWAKKRAEEFLSLLIPEPEKTQKASTIAATQRDAIMARYLHSENLDNVRGTKYAMLQAVAEYLDYDHRTRIVDDGRPTEVQKAELLWLRSVESHPLKERAHKLLVAA